ncbi:MAG TPA: diguanylate cyclase [candidate division WOR-3 bacterium]|uniref:Diguanylate cyclase n=1 Tax=candidate division WOR-3 bacterium TaxID=2052148 RepID=A0A9C9EKU9_UNCW3|nr:diguanylate cyclase [candidate division WOR-3 bacterium]
MSRAAEENKKSSEKPITRNFRKKLTEEINLAKKNTRCLSIILIELYKCFLDSNRVTEKIPERTVKDFKKILHRILRANDTYEFLGSNRVGLIIVGADRDDTTIVRKLISEEVSKGIFHHNPEKPSVIKIAIGSASFPQDAVTIPDLLKAAESRLKKQTKQLYTKSVSKIDSSITYFRNISKFTPPVMPQKILMRSGILKRIKNAEKKRFTFISSGPGFGKTTILYEYTKRVKKKTVWLKLDESDRNPLVFLSDFLTGINLHYKNFGRKTRALLQGDMEIEYLINSLIQEINTFRDGRMIYILDDFQQIEQNQQTVDIIYKIIDCCPNNLHLIITSRKRIPKFLHKFVVDDEALLLTEKDLRLDLAETKKMAEILKVPITPQKIKKIWEETRGWAFAIKSMLALKIETNRTTEDIFDYISEEIYNRFSRRMKHLLLSLAFFPFFNTQILKKSLAENFDERTEQELLNLPFLEVTSGEIINYTFHPLFKNYLMMRAKNDMSDYEIKKCKEKVAEYYEKNGDYDNAIELFIEAGNYRKAIKNINIIGTDIADAGNISKLTSWLDRIPKKLTETTPKLLILWALTEERRGNFKISKELITRAEKVLKGLKKNRGLYAHLFVAKATILKHQGKLNPALRMAKLAYDSSRNQETKIFAFVIMSLCYFHKYNFKEAIKTGEQGLQIADSIMSRASQYFLNNLGTIFLHNGELNKAQTYLNRCINEAKQLNRTYQYIVALGNYTKVLIHLGDFSNAEKMNEEALGFSKKYKFANLEIQNLNSRALLSILQGRYEKALRYHSRALEIAEEYKNKYLITICNLKIASLYSILKDPDEIKRHLDSIEKLISQKTDSREFIQYLIIKARCELMQHNLRKVKKRIERISRLAKRMKILDYIIQGNLLRYQFEKEYDRTKEAHHYLKKMLDIIERTECNGLFLHQVLLTPELLIDALEFSDKKSYLISFINNFILSSEEVSEAVMNQLSPEQKEEILSLGQPTIKEYHLTAYLFGEPRVYMGNRPLSGEYWLRKKVKQLLCLLLLYKEGITKDKLQALFWPKSNRPNADRNFWNTLYYLRKTLEQGNGTRKIITRRNNRIIIEPSLKIFTDIEQFQHLVNRANYHLQNNDVDRATAEFEKALILYSSDLLEPYYENWIEQKRAYYKSLKEEAALKLAKLYLEGGKFRKAFDVYTEILESDPLSEEAVIGLLKAGQKPQLKAEAVKRYKKYAKKLKAELAVEPSPELQKAYQNLTA